MGGRGETTEDGRRLSIMRGSRVFYLSKAHGRLVGESTRMWFGLSGATQWTQEAISSGVEGGTDPRRGSMSGRTVREIAKDVEGAGTSSTRSRNLGQSAYSRGGGSNTHRGITTGRVTRLNAQEDVLEGGNTSRGGMSYRFCAC